jgi:gluconolactonase
MAELREITSGLEFPEGPVALADGSVLVVEIKGGRLTRVLPDGTHKVVAETGGGPNGAALGPDGKVWVCNNGGFEWHDAGGLTLPGNQPADYSGGRIERVDLETGGVEVVYTECGGVPLRGPNDLVFDAEGGLWFTDHGKTRERDRDRTGIFYAAPDGSRIEEKVFPLDAPNGIGLSPDGSTVVIDPRPTPNGGTLLAGLPGLQLLDSLAVDGAGNVCVATIVNGGVTTISPDGGSIEHLPTGDPLTTNICFGGEGLRTAYITLSGTGRLVATEWPRPGLPLHFGQV